MTKSPCESRTKAKRKRLQDKHRLLYENHSKALFDTFHRYPVMLTKKDLKCVPGDYLIAKYPNLIPHLIEKLPFQLQLDVGIREKLYCDPNSHPHSSQIMKIDCPLSRIDIELISPLASDDDEEKVEEEVTIEKEVIPPPVTVKEEPTTMAFYNEK